MLQQSWRMLVRDWRAGELRLLLVAVAVAVAALASVGFFAERMSKALTSQAKQLLGADAVFVSDNPIEQRFIQSAKNAKLQTAQTIVFPSMVGATGEQSRLVAPQLSSLKAVSEGYPLRGALTTTDRPGGENLIAQKIPATGTVWVDPQLLAALGLKMGDSVEIGERQFRVDRLIAIEPDRGTNFVNFAPRAMINLNDLPATGLIQAGSRVSYRLLLSGPVDQVESFVAAIKPSAGQRFEDIKNGRPELSNTLDRAEKFLSLVALLSALIAGTAIALAARRFFERHLDGCAVMKAIGFPQGQLARLLLLELSWVGLGAAIVGVAIGFAAHFVLIASVSPFIKLSLPAPSLLPAIQASSAGVILLLGFAGLPVLRLAGVAPLRVLRRDLGAANKSIWLTAFVGLIACSGLLIWFARDLRLAALSLGGFLVSGLVFGLVAWGLMASISRAGRAAEGGGFAMIRVMLANWAKRGPASIAQMVALAFSLTALLLLTVTRNDLLDSWRKASPPDAPNRFVINIQPDQVNPVRTALIAAGIQQADLAPMIRGRLVVINGREVNLEAFAERARRTLDRELNLSYMNALPSHNETIAGRWINPSANEVSVEEGIAESLGLKIGDRLGFDIAGEIKTVTVVGLRKVAWDSMKVNFFMILSPEAAKDQPQTFVTALRVQDASKPKFDQLVRDFPNLTIFDTDNIIRQVQTVLNQVSRAIEFLFGFTLLAGLLVLYAAQTAGQQDRQKETALMRALGASRKQLSRSLTAELLLTGGLAGLMAGIAATAIGFVLAKTIFEFTMGLSLWPIVIGIIGGALAALSAGWWNLRKIVNTPPLLSLRQE